MDSPLLAQDKKNPGWFPADHSEATEMRAPDIIGIADLALEQQRHPIRRPIRWIPGRGFSVERALRASMRNAAEKARELGHSPTRFTVDTEMSAISVCARCLAYIAVDIDEAPYMFGRGVNSTCTYTETHASCNCAAHKALREAGR